MTEHFDPPALDEWWTLPQAAAELGISRQAVHQMVKEGKFSTIRRLGDKARPILVIQASEVLALASHREEQQHAILS